MNTQSEWVKCNFCGNNNRDDFDVVLKERIMKKAPLESGFQLVRCNKCGLMYVNPRPKVEYLARYYYEEWYGYGEGIIPRSSESNFTNNYFRWRFEKISKYCPSGKVVDVGCQTGGLLKCFYDGGYDVYGIELSDSYRKFCIEQFGFVVFKDLFDVPFVNDSVDIVTFIHCLEHVPNPRQQMKKAYDMLRPDGLLVIEVPSADSLMFRIFKRNLWGLMLPMHLYQFTSDVLKSQLKLIGFDIMEINQLPMANNIIYSLVYLLSDILQIEHPVLPNRRYNFFGNPKSEQQFSISTTNPATLCNTINGRKSSKNNLKLLLWNNFLFPISNLISIRLNKIGLGERIMIICRKV